MARLVRATQLKPVHLMQKNLSPPGWPAFAGHDIFIFGGRWERNSASDQKYFRWYNDIVFNIECAASAMHLHSSL
jgi:hypothetical protein